MSAVAVRRDDGVAAGDAAVSMDGTLALCSVLEEKLPLYSLLQSLDADDMGVVPIASITALLSRKLVR